MDRIIQGGGLDRNVDRIKEIFLVVLCIVYLVQSSVTAVAVFGVKPRVRREWRTLSPEMRDAVASAIWTMKNMSTEEGQTLYGDFFRNYDELVMQHACSLTDPRCDQAHGGPQFLTFHRAYLLQFENSLIAIDPSIEAMPYWNHHKDVQGGEYHEDEDQYIFSNKYFGTLNGDENHIVTTGLFANWPIAEWSSAEFGADSSLQNQCARQELFKGKRPLVCKRCCGQEQDCTCDPENDVFPIYFRSHDNCAPYVTRDQFETGPMGGTYELIGSESDFDACIDPSYIKSWMDWNNCFEGDSISCVLFNAINATCAPPLAGLLSILPLEGESAAMRDVTAAVLGNCASDTCDPTSFRVSPNGTKETLHSFHGYLHFRLGLDMKDVITSPNDVGVFFGLHGNLDRNNMHWQMASRESLQDSLWGYPTSQDDYVVMNDDRVQGPYSSFPVLTCLGNLAAHPDYIPFGSPWLNGTLAKDTISASFPFTDIFSDPPDNGVGYTHAEVLSYTAPDRTPYTYDTLESLYYDEGKLPDETSLSSSGRSPSFCLSLFVVLSLLYWTIIGT